MLLVDTSVLVDFFKGKRNPQTTFLSSFVDQGGVISICALSVIEILQGAKNDKEWQQLESVLSTQNIIYPEESFKFIARVSSIYFELRKKGKTLRGTIDCIIAQIALDNKAVLLHNDKDFDLIKAIRPLKTWS